MRRSVTYLMRESESELDLVRRNICISSPLKGGSEDGWACSKRCPSDLTRNHDGWNGVGGAMAACEVLLCLKSDVGGSD